MIGSIVFAKNRVTLVFRDEVTFEDLIEANGQIMGNANFPEIDQQLWHFHSIKKFDIDRSQMERVIRTALEASIDHIPIKVAIVSSSDLAFGLGRMYQVIAHATPWETMVFRTLEEAEKWFAN